MSWVAQQLYLGIYLCVIYNFGLGQLLFDNITINYITVPATTNILSVSHCKHGQVKRCQLFLTHEFANSFSLSHFRLVWDSSSWSFICYSSTDPSHTDQNWSMERQTTVNSGLPVQSHLSELAKLQPIINVNFFWNGNIFVLLLIVRNTSM